MKRSNPKLAIPKDSRALPRERLFKALDRAPTRRVTWIAAPPGAGKTVLLASWLRARRLRALWCTLDEGDDVASFFGLLRDGAGALPGGRRINLPRFQPEHLATIAPFARQFFARLGAARGRPDVLVLDDYHAVGPDSLLHRALAEGAAAVAAVPVVVASRAGPPRQYAKLRAGGGLVALPADALTLTSAEARAVARLRGVRAPSARALALASGWAAGVVLVAMAGRRGPDAGMVARRSVFEYLASEVFDGADGRTRDVLLQTCLLTTVDAEAVERRGVAPGAGEVLADLARAGWFVQAVRGARGTFRFHALFREFLAARARDLLGADAFTASVRRSAALLLEAGDLDGAAELLSAEGAWDELAGLLAEHAPALAAAGRMESLHRWIQAVPAARAEEDPWIRFWRGVSGFLGDPPRAIADVEWALEAFSRQGDALGSLRSWATSVDLRFFALDDYAPLTRSLEALPGLLERFPPPDPATEGAVVGAALTACSNLRAGDPDTLVWEDRACELALRPGDPRLRMDLGRSLLLGCAYWGTDLPRARLVLDALGPIANAPDADPMHALVWHLGASNYHTHLGDAAQGIAVATNGLAIAERSGVRAWDALLLSVRIYAALADEDFASAGRDLKLLARAAVGGRLATCSYHYTAATVAARRGDARGAVEHARFAARLAEECSHPLAIAAVASVWATAAIQGGGDGPTRAAAVALARSSGYLIAEMGLHLVGAAAALAAGDEAGASAALGEAFAIARRTGALNSVYVSRADLAEVCAFALERGIAADLAERIVRMRRLSPGPRARGRAAWPWRVRVRTVGDFEVLCDGLEPPSGKAQKKPLELLRLLVDAGERGATLGWLTDALWPDADGDVGLHALETAIYRLRRLLGDAEAVVRRGGRLALDPARVFVDAWARAGRPPPGRRAP